MFKSQGKGDSVAFFSANTDAGRGNGSELAIAVQTEEELLAAICLSGLPIDDKNNQAGNAQNPIIIPLGPVAVGIASDPGNVPD